MEILYVHSEEIHNTTAAEIIVPLIFDITPVSSVLDVGCGTGTWLSVFQKHHVKDIMGLDGAYVDRTKLKIDETFFQKHDLRKPFTLNRKFDLVLCLEVAEHLPESCAQAFVACICRHTDKVVFSAAIPGQDGQNHINEQWPVYWENEFNRNGFTKVDAIRPKIWNDSRVEVWYRQNIFLYVRKNQSFEQMHFVPPVAEVHPEFWIEKVKQIENLKKRISLLEEGNEGIKRTFKAFVKSILNRFLCF